jgi:outer membrane biosynthesis protein TonB
MTVRRTLPYLLAAMLGVGAALLAACGSGTDAGIPSANASDLKSQISDVRQAVEDRRCADVAGQLRQVDERIDDLPPSTDDQLVNNLRDGADKLLGVARQECDAESTQTTTTETQTTNTTETTQEPIQTPTTPADTTTTSTATVQTPPPPPPPPPPAPEPQPEPEPEPVPPPPPSGTPGGGVEPEIP